MLPAGVDPEHVHDFEAYTGRRVLGARCDYAVIAAYLAAITAFGSWFARYQHTTQRLLPQRPHRAVVGGVLHGGRHRDQHAHLHRHSGHRLCRQLTFLQLALGYVIGRILVSVLFIPAYFRGDLVTSYELLQRRFGRRVTTLSAGLFLVTRSLADGIRLFATALVIGVVTGVLADVDDARRRRR